MAESLRYLRTVFGSENTDALCMELAYSEASFSRDPSTQVGAIIVSGPKIIGRGYNRFAQGLKVTDDRLNDKDQKLPRTVHAEVAAIIDAVGNGYADKLEGSVMFAPWYACDRCATMIIEAGIKTVVGHANHPGVNRADGRWASSTAMGLDMLREAGIECRYYEGELGCDPVRFSGQLFMP